MKNDLPVDPSIPAQHVHPMMQQVRACCDQRDEIARLMSSLGELEHEAEFLKTWYLGKGDRPDSLLLKSSMNEPNSGNTFMVWPGHTHGFLVEISFKPNDECWFMTQGGFDPERWGRVIPKRLQDVGPHRLSTEEAMKLVKGIIARFAKLEANGWKRRLLSAV